MFSDMPRKDLYVASNNLKQLGLIYAHFVEGNELFAARILDEGLVYIEENPSLENPVDDNEIKRLQKDELEYKKRIRMQERIIRYWKLSNPTQELPPSLDGCCFSFSSPDNNSLTSESKKSASCTLYSTTV
jgi:hypothetical protein